MAFDTNHAFELPETTLCFSLDPCSPSEEPSLLLIVIGGFFFLRFINPAIVTPQAYMLVDGVPAKHPRRTLTLVCPEYLVHDSILSVPDRKNASKPGEQTVVRQGGVYDHPQSIRREQ